MIYKYLKNVLLNKKKAQSLGHAAFVPEKEGYSTTRSQLLAQMDVSMGGRVAEELSKFIVLKKKVIHIFLGLIIFK